jgi:lipopolysaccharide transport system ATP-binding protein
MSNAIITVDNLSKSYLVGHESVQRDRYTALRDVIAREVRNFARKATDLVHGRQIVEGDEVEEFWALKNVSFQVKEGEVLGIIGRNGAGKSTLLKILSRITEPTEGRVLLRGRVASLLEVGTGFHPELTGRENIFLNGAILGMTQREIRKKFDEIVAFAEIQKFLDTPVKRYSSGMYVRLAFAVAAHLEPEILVVDEVLAVGDAKFQEKCLGKMEDVATEGRTVIFVSHNMGAVMQLTSRAVVLSEGLVDFIGAPSEAVGQYIQGQHLKDRIEFDVSLSKRRYQGTGDVKILSLSFDRPLPRFEFCEPIRYIIRVHAECAVKRLRVSMTVFAKDGSPVGSCFSPEIDGLAAGEECDLVVTLGSARLAPGRYFCGVSVGSGSHRSVNVDYDVVMDTLFFDVDPERTPQGSIASWAPEWGSISLPDLTIAPMSNSVRAAKRLDDRANPLLTL